MSFEKHFKKVPIVVAFIAGVEIAHDYDHRLSVAAVNIATDGFDLQIGIAFGRFLRRLFLSQFSCRNLE